MDLTIYNSYTAQACVLVILGLYQSHEHPVLLIIFWCWELKWNHLAFKIHGSLFFFSSVIHGSLKISICFLYLILNLYLKLFFCRRIDGCEGGVRKVWCCEGIQVYW